MIVPNIEKYLPSYATLNNHRFSNQEKYLNWNSKDSMENKSMYSGQTAFRLMKNLHSQTVPYIDKDTKLIKGSLQVPWVLCTSKCPELHSKCL